MAVTTFENFYTLVKNNIVYFQYQKGDIVLNIKGTLDINNIPQSDTNIHQYDRTTEWANFNSGLWVGSDSDSILLIEKNKDNKFTAPEWLKIYSTNYEMWINIEIAKINSLQVVDS